LETKATTLRLGKELAEDLETVAQVDGVPISEAIRDAITKHIEERRQDADFQARLKASLERNQEILRKLAQ
jgi:predicted DNA-binding protein